MSILLIKRILQVAGFILLLASYAITYRSGYVKAQVEFQNKQLINTEVLLSEMPVLEKQRGIAHDQLTDNYITRIQYTRPKEKQLSNEATNYHTPSEDSRCAIPLGFQLHWNRSNQTNISDTVVYKYAVVNENKVSDKFTEQRLTEVTQCKATEEQLIQLHE